ncbi:unnamed protein product [Mucor hiemalis]
MYYKPSHVFLFCILILSLITYCTNDLIQRDDEEVDTATTTTTTTSTSTKTNYDFTSEPTPDSSSTNSMDSTNSVDQDIYNELTNPSIKTFTIPRNCLMDHPMKQISLA